MPTRIVVAAQGIYFCTICIPKVDGASCFEDLLAEVKELAEKLCFGSFQARECANENTLCVDI